MSDHLLFHKKFSARDFDDQYNLRAGRPDFELTVISHWQQRSEAARASVKGQIDIRYSDGEKQKLDVFTCGDPSAPTLVYFHGGYWQSGDKALYGFLAEPLVASGANVVVVGYDLCPSVTITQISEQAREAMAYTWRNATDLGINRDRLTVMGHSAGGHIALMMMGTDWPSYGGDLPADLVVAGIPVSPISYLEPVRLTEFLNANLHMTPQEAEKESPMTSHPPATNAPQMVVVGGAETDEFHRQAKMYVDTFNTGDRQIELYIVPDVDHFDELNVLADPASIFFKKTRAIIGGTN